MGSEILSPEFYKESVFKILGQTTCAILGAESKHQQEKSFYYTAF